MFDFMYVDGVNVLTYAEEQKKAAEAAEEQLKAAEEKARLAEEKARFAEEVLGELQEQKKLNEKAFQEIEALKAELRAKS
jgi:predicted ATPase